MQSQISKLVELLVLFALSLFLIFSFTLFLNGTKLWSQEAAGWAQAIGAITSIGCAFSIASWQWKRQLHEACLQKREEELRSAIFLEEIIHKTQICLDHSRNTIQKWPDGIPFANNNENEIDALLFLVRTLIQRALPIELMASASDTYLTLTKAESYTMELIGQTHFKSNSRIEMFYNLLEDNISKNREELTQIIKTYKGES